MRELAILGSTGSIGTQTLELVRADHVLHAVVLAAHGNIDLLEAQIQEFAPELVCVYHQKKAEELAERLGVKLTQLTGDAQSDDETVRNAVLENRQKKNAAKGAHGTAASLPVIVTGMEGLLVCARYAPAETVVVAVVGMIGIRPTMAALSAGKNVALANKETLVCAGHLIMPMAERPDGSSAIIPVDSEHSAIYQCLVGEKKASVEKLLLTASGGPFRGRDLSALETIRPEDALKHPNWSMGAKITIDSSTMVNKALEVMEAHWLFDVPVDAIEIVVQPQSIIHSMVAFRDGAVKAQLGVPSMLIPIEYALYAPGRRSLPAEEKLDFAKLSSIELSVPDLEVFRGLWLGIEAGKQGGIMPTIFNAANEEAVAAFLGGNIRYLDIPASIEAAMRAVGGFTGSAWKRAEEEQILLCEAALAGVKEVSASAKQRAEAALQKAKEAAAVEQDTFSWSETPDVAEILRAETAARTYVKEILALA